MSTPLDSLREANRVVLATLVERDAALVARERALTDELTTLANERKVIAADVETLKKAEMVHARLQGGAHAEVPVSSPPVLRQARARIGRQRYLMLAAIRDYGPISVVDVANRTGLNPARVREQTRSDQPVHIALDPHSDADPGPVRMVLTSTGENLLSRFEAYRRAQGKALPSIDDDLGDNDNNDDEDLGVETNKAADDGSSAAPISQQVNPLAAGSHQSDPVKGGERQVVHGDSLEP